MCQDCREGERIRKAILDGTFLPHTPELGEISKNPPPQTEFEFEVCSRCGGDSLWCLCP